jgi:hypothetical protein
MAIRTEFDVEKVLDDYQHETGDESLLKYMGNDLFLPESVEYEDDAVVHDLSDQLGDGYDFKWSDAVLQTGTMPVNNLNFDTDENYGLGVTAYNIFLNTTARGATTDFSLYDSNDFNPGSGDRATSGDAAGSSVDPEALARTLWFYPIKISGIIYRVADATGTGGDPRIQLNDAKFDFLRQNIDGSILRKGQIQPNYLRRNWWFQDDLAVLSGELLITPDTQQIVQVFDQNNIDLTFLVESIGW